VDRLNRGPHIADVALNKKWDTMPIAQSALRDGKYDDVIKRCLKDLEKTPTHTQAHWYLGRAYYAKQMWPEAKREMELVGELEPTWRDEYTKPYLEEIEKKLQQGS